MFETKFVEKINKHFMFGKPPPPEYGRGGQTTDLNSRIIRRKRVVCWITKATDSR
jgi:hypothetical protein